MEIFVVNVFSEKGIKGGNQLGIVLDAESLSTTQMQMIARQMNYSESTFVLNHTDTLAEFKIFLPTSEIPYAGHPIIGTSHVLEYLNRQQRLVRDKIIARVPGGDVHVYFDDTLEITYMDQLPVKDEGDYKHTSKLLDALGIDKGMLRGSTLPVITPSSLKFIFVPIKEISTVEELDPDFSELKELLKSGNYAVYAFAEGGKDEGDFHTRMFAPAQGINEDPATGSAQSAFIHALAKLDLLDDRSLIRVEQGYEINRPSLLYNKISTNNQQLQIRTGGKCHLALKGQLFL